MTTTAVDTTPRGLAHVAYDEARRVEEAYASQVVKRRRRWREAVPGKDADRARRDLAEALQQESRAHAIKLEAWRAWHALGGPQT